MKKRYRSSSSRGFRGRLLFRLALDQVVFPDAPGPKDIAESSRNQIKVYAQSRLTRRSRSSSPWARGPTAAEYSFLSRQGYAPLPSAKQAPPPAVDGAGVLEAYTSREDLSTDTEDWYRAQTFALKDLKNQTMQLGLDLRGGMYVTVRLDFAAREALLGQRSTTPRGKTR